jgi:hypothetical protein
MMSHAAEIASAARDISAEKLATALQKAEISVLKKNIGVHTRIQQELINMLRELQPHLGSSVNITV